MIEELLPIGTVVRIGEGGPLATIMGFYPDDGKRMYDYLAAPLPMGLATAGHAILLDTDGISEVVSRGYLDPSGREALKGAAAIMNAREEAFVAIGAELERQGRLGGDDDFHML